jgi:hypothetical protein
MRAAHAAEISALFADCDQSAYKDAAEIAEDDRRVRQALREALLGPILMPTSDGLRAPMPPLIIPDVVVDRLRKYIKDEAVETVLSRPNPTWFDGLSAIGWVRAGHSWEEVLTKYDELFQFGRTA